MRTGSISFPIISGSGIWPRSATAPRRNRGGFRASMPSQQKAASTLTFAGRLTPQHCQKVKRPLEDLIVRESRLGLRILLRLPPNHPICQKQDPAQQPNADRFGARSEGGAVAEVQLRPGAEPVSIGLLGGILLLTNRMIRRK